MASEEEECLPEAAQTNPFPFYQVYKGNLFELVDQAVNFVLSKIDLAVGTRAAGPEAPVAYEIPPEVISEQQLPNEIELTY